MFESQAATVANTAELANTSDQQQIAASNLIKILVATDNHLGYGEKDHIRGQDSFVTFEEILQHAVQNEVDFILLGGDLFHDAKPSPNTLQRCMKLLRQYTLGDKPIGLEFLSDQAQNFGASLNGTVNYEDPNMNIAYPVFSIHGNHDDPSGFGRLSALDLLSTNGLVNYFGKWTDLTKVNIAPILLRKGSTQLALYGLSYIQDCRLARLFQDTKVVLERPEAEDGSGAGDGDDDDNGSGNGGWFNLMVLHQNRADRGPKNFLPERILPDFIDLFIWGHEHDCRIVPERNTEHRFYVSQPGSSVATSLAEGESLPKHCGLLLVHGTEFKLEPIKLQTVRPFVFDTVDLGQFDSVLRLKEKDALQRIQDFVAARIEELIGRAAEQLTGHPGQPKLPLVRLRIVYDTEVQMFNSVRFGNAYSGRVANPIDMILFKKNARRRQADVADVDQVAMRQVFGSGRVDEHTRVEDIVNRYFEEADETARLEVLFPKSMNEMCRRLVDMDDDDAVDNMLQLHHSRACDFLNNLMPTKEDALEQLGQLELQADSIYESAVAQLDARGTARSGTTGIANAAGSDSTSTTTTTAATVGSRWSVQSNASVDFPAPATAAAAKPASKAAAGRAKPTTGPGSRGGRGGRAATAAASRAAAAAAAATNRTTSLNVSITRPAAAAAQQQSILSSFASQTTRQQMQRGAKSSAAAGAGTQYISDSDSN